MSPTEPLRGSAREAPPVSWWRTSLGRQEIDAVSRAIADEHISQGPLTPRFEAAFARALDAPHAVATPSGSAALLLALMAVGVRPGDEVIVPNRTFHATAHAALLLGARVRLVDTLPDVPLIDPSQVRSSVTPRTKAIMVVHLNGRAAPVQAVNDIAAEFNLAVIEDAAQAFYSRTEAGFLGTQSHIGCFSLGVTKLITTGQGGMCVTRDRALADRLRLLRNHGVVDTMDAEYCALGFNFKFTDMQSAIGLAQLARLGEKVSRSLEIYRQYERALPRLPFLRMLPVDVARGELPLWVEMLCAERAPFLAHCAEHGIQVRKFLPDLDRSPHIDPSSGAHPNSRRFHDQGMQVPSGPGQSVDDINRAIEVFAAYHPSRPA